jgi:hypothetical protein
MNAKPYFSGDSVPSFVLVWNPTVWRFAELPTLREALSAQKPATIDWAAGVARNARINSRIFLLRRGTAPEGIIGAGWVVQDAHTGPHYDPKRASRGVEAVFVTVEWEALLDPLVEEMWDINLKMLGKV